MTKGLDEQLTITKARAEGKSESGPAAVCIKADHYKELIETLKFYADSAGANWYRSTDGHMYFSTITKDDVTTKPGVGFYSGGKRARAILKKLGITNDESGI